MPGAAREARRRSEALIGPFRRWGFRERQRHVRAISGRRNIDNLASALDGVALLDETIVTEDRDADIIGLQVADVGREFHHLLS